MDTAEVSVAMQFMAEFNASASVSTTQTRAATEALRGRVQDLDRLTQRFELRGHED